MRISSPRRHLIALGLTGTLLGSVWAQDKAPAPQVKLSTSLGDIVLELNPEKAPKSVDNFLQYVKDKHYDGTIFHRVIDGFMAQTGDPTGTGRGGSMLPDLEPEFNDVPHVRGSVSMARARTENSANSQFYIVFYPKFALDRKYTNFGRVIGNMAAVDAIHRGEPPLDPTKIVQASIAADNVPPPPASMPDPVGEQIIAGAAGN